MKVLWVKKDRLGRPLHPWEEITLDQLTPEAQKLIQKMARVSARDFFEEVKEEWTEAWSTDIGRRVTEAMNAAQTGAQGAPVDTAPAPAAEAPGELLAAIPEQREAEAPACTGPHICGGQRVGWCRESCVMCSAELGRLAEKCRQGCAKRGGAL